MKIVEVKFSPYKNGQYEGKSYNYIATQDNIKEGDFLVVDTPSSGYTIVKVVDVSEYKETTKANKYVVDKIDVEAYQNRLQREKDLKLLKAKLDKKVSERQSITIYEKFADDDPEIADLLSEYKQRLSEDLR